MSKPKTKLPRLEPPPDEHQITIRRLEPFGPGQDSIDLAYYLSQDYVDIQQATAEMPAAIEWVNEMAQRMYEQRLNLATALAEERAKVFFDMRRGRLETDYGGKPTEAALDHAIALNDEVQDLERQLNVAKGWVKRLAGVQLTLLTKLDLIRSSEATRRRLVEPAELELDRAKERARREREDDNDN